VNPLVIDRDFVTQTLINLVRINSINPSLVPGAPGEGSAAAHVDALMRALGMTTAIHESEPGRPSVVGVLKGTGGGRSLMLNGHLDTVGIMGMPNPFSAEIRDGRLYGRGSEDMKGGLAASFGAVKAIVDRGIALGGDLVVATVADEEHASLGTADIVSRYCVDGAIVTEATNIELCTAHKGFAWLEVETLGRAAHGARFQEGIDANLLMGQFLCELARLERDLRRRPPHALLGPPSLHAATLAGGSGLSTYAARCNLEIERRTIPGESERAVVGELRAIVDLLTTNDPTFQATIRTILWREPFEASETSALIDALDQAADRVLRRPLPRIGQGGWMDSALLSAAGVDTVILGPSGGGPHSEVEWVELHSVYQTAAVIAEAAVTYCR